MDGPGTISWEEFLENAEAFVRVSNEISDSWQLRGEKEIPGQAYLYRRMKSFVPSNYLDRRISKIDDETTETWQKEELNEDGNLDFEIRDKNDPYVANGENEQPFLMEHHILWHMNYGVPVMYFNAWFSDFPGINAISVEKAQRAMPQNILSYGELSQAIHPLLGTTFLYLHPCKSQELLATMFKSKNKLVSWLSAVSPAALNLKLSLKYYELTRSKDSKIGSPPKGKK